MTFIPESTPRSELLRWRALAEQAAARYDVKRPRLELIKCGENITYRIGQELLLRIHRPIYHSPQEVRSELAWLEALAVSTDLPVPRPLRPNDGDTVAIVRPEWGEAHVCTMLRWMPGRQREKPPEARHMRALGRSTALLHDHALSWRKPEGFVRMKLDWDGLLARKSNWGRMPCELPEMFQEADRSCVREALERIREAMRRLDRLPGSRALIHADLHLGNVVFAGGKACPIDFDDSGFGYLIYDLATTLIPYCDRPGYEERRDALLEGYSDIRSISDKEIELLPEFLAVRGLTMAIWLTMRRPYIPRLPRDLGSYLARTAALCRNVTAGRKSEPIALRDRPSL